MGFGDFKLFAALGAWFGWQALVPIILMASVIGALVGIGDEAVQRPARRRLCAFRPVSWPAPGLTAMVFGPQSILRVVGL
jgi:leader peptidase (prepilin peptidase)/N-methyltransferase